MSPPLSFSEKFSAESRRLARMLNEINYIYALYGMMDGLSISYSMVKYIFDLLPSTNRSSSKMMHDWLLTPEGVAIAALESITLIAFSLLANIYSDNDENAFKRYIAIAWPYCRDSMKGLKNAYKGVRSTILAFNSITDRDINYLIAPVGIVLGLLSVLNRYWMRKYVREPRIAMTKMNAKLLLEIKGTPFHLASMLPEVMTPYLNSFILVGDVERHERLQLYYINADTTSTCIQIEEPGRLASNIKILMSKNETLIHLSDVEIKGLITDNGGYLPPLAALDEATLEGFRKRKEQSDFLNNWALMGAAYGGIVDGLYLYMGALALAALSAPACLVMTICSLIFSLMCVIVRVYEEYDYQRQFHGTQVKIELALCARELEALLATLQWLSDPIKLTQDDNALGVLLNNLKTPMNPTTAIISRLEVLRDLLNGLKIPAEPGGSFCELMKKGIQQLRQLGEDPAALILLETTLNMPDGRMVDTVRELYIEKLKMAYKDELSPKKQAFDIKREKLNSYVTLSSSSLVIFAGIRNGLAAFSAITSLMFTVAAIDSIVLVAFQPALLLISVGLGMLSIIIFVIHSLYSNPSHLIKAPLNEVHLSDDKLITLLKSVKDPHNKVQDIKPTVVKEVILGGMVVDPSPQFFIQEWFEVIRSLGSGFYKGPKLAEFAENILQGLGLFWGDDDSSVMFRISIMSAFFQGVTFSLRALARGFGRDAPDVVQSKKLLVPPSDLISPPRTPVEIMPPAARSSWFSFFSPVAVFHVIPPAPASLPH